MEIWRKKIRVCVSLLLLVLTTACFEQYQGGFPKHATLPKKGGKITLLGEEHPFQILLESADGDIVETNRWSDNYEDPDTVFIQYDWLTLSYSAKAGAWIELSATPNTTHKKRTLYVLLNFGGRDGDIKVTQKK